MTCGDAVAKGTIANETLAYFMARTQLFMLRIGMNSEKLRFRQHLIHGDGPLRRGLLGSRNINSLWLGRMRGPRGPRVL